MTSERWQRLKELVIRAMELPVEERDAFLVRECGGDESLLAEARSLVATMTSTGFLEPPDPAPAFEEPATEGLRLGEFEILRELGHGGMGVVYQAHQPSLHRDVAVKVLVAGLSTTTRQIERFHRESKAVAGLSHPGIVQVFASGSSGNTHWFAMELVPGHDLQREVELQRRETLPGQEGPTLPRPGEPNRAATIARVCAEVARALEFAHTRGLVHRDVKPSNLLLRPDGRIQIGDFGIARDESLGELTGTGEIPGSPYYMSPEQTRLRQVQIDHRTDIFSLGVVLYELLVLRRPFEGATHDDIFNCIREVEPTSIRSLAPEVPRDLELICMTALAKAPERRYATAGAFADDLIRFVNHEAVAARAPSAWDRSRHWFRQHRVKLAAVALLLAGAGIGLLAALQASAARTTARLSVQVVDADGAPVEGTIGLRRIDPTLGSVGELQPLGMLPFEESRIAPGYVRVVADLAGAGEREFTRMLEAGQPLEIRAAVGPQQRLPEPRAGGAALAEGTVRAGMVWIAGGTLALRDQNQPLVPQNGRDIPVDGFWLDETEVSNGEYREFLGATAAAPPTNWSRLDDGVHDDLPVVDVSWQDAVAYAEWRGKRLPSFDEWTWAARGSEDNPYPWGEADDGRRGNASKPAINDRSHDFDLYLASAAPVRSHEEARTPSGLFHMFGNVSEWTESLLGWRDLQVHEPDPLTRLVAGFAWDASTRHHSLTTFAFERTERSYANNHIGFRCALSAYP